MGWRLLKSAREAEMRLGRSRWILGPETPVFSYGWDGLGHRTEGTVIGVRDTLHSCGCSGPLPLSQLPGDFPGECL